MTRARVFAFLLANAVAALVLAGSSSRAAAERCKSVARAVEVVPSYGAAVAELAKKKKLAEVMADAVPGAWSRRAQAAAVELGYAQLTGDYDAYAAADRSLAEAFRVARASIDDESVGPLLLRAQLSYELHRLGPALDSLRALERQQAYFHDPRMAAEIASLRGAALFARGDYDAGIAEMRRSIELDPSAGHQQRLALALAKIGGEDEARRIFDATETASAAPRALAWLELTRAKLDREHGRRAEMRRHLENARALFPGSWPSEELYAELDADEGHVERAIAAYRRLIETTGDPEFMDALARLVPDREEAARLSARSEAIYRHRLAILPEASYGHALEHYLRMAPDPARAVEIAEKNRDLRPNGEAWTRLAQAYLRAGRIKDACAAIERAVTSKWVSGESYATAAIAFRRAGRDAAAMEQKALAENPLAFDYLAWL